MVSGGDSLHEGSGDRHQKGDPGSLYDWDCGDMRRVFRGASEGEFSGGGGADDQRAAGAWETIHCALELRKAVCGGDQKPG